MSKEKAPDKDKAAARGGGSKGKLILIIVIAVVAIGGGGGWLFMSNGGKAQGAQGAASSAPARPAPAQYYKFDPAFVVNFGGPENSRFLQLQVEAMTRDPAVLELVKANEPAIRNDLLLLFSSQTYEVLMSATGKEGLRKSTADAVRKVLAREGARPEALEDVFFTSFVIQ